MNRMFGRLSAAATDRTNWLAKNSKPTEATKRQIRRFINIVRSLSAMTGYALKVGVGPGSQFSVPLTLPVHFPLSPIP